MFRRSREIAGAFVLLAAGLLIAGIVMHGQIRGWFQPKNIFEVALPEAGTQGVRPGSEVYIMGNKAGTVTRVEMRRKITELAISAAPTADSATLDGGIADASADAEPDAEAPPARPRRRGWLPDIYDDSYVPEGLAGLEFERQLTKRQKVTFSVEYFPDVTDPDEFRANSKAAWEMLVDPDMNLNLKLSVTDRYDSTPNGAKRNDLDYSLLLLWKY